MKTSFLSREQLLDAIIALEERMFVTVKASSPSECQKHLHAFRTMRRMGHSVISDETLASYLQDLREASAPKTEDGSDVPDLPGYRKPSRNFFTEKYARIDNQIPLLNDNPVIDEIVAIESAWFHQLRSRFPGLLHESGSFERFTHSELETYSDRTLALFARDMRAAKEQGRNLVEERYRFLYQTLDLGTLEVPKASIDHLPHGEIKVL